MSYKNGNGRMFALSSWVFYILYIFLLGCSRTLCCHTWSGGFGLWCALCEVSVEGFPGPQLHPKKKTLETTETKTTNLVVFYGHVMSSPLQVCDLGEVPCNQCFLDTSIIRRAVKVRAAHPEAQSAHDADKLPSNVVSILQWSGIDENLITPLGIFVCIGVFFVQTSAGQWPLQSDWWIEAEPAWALCY